MPVEPEKRARHRRRLVSFLLQASLACAVIEGWAQEASSGTDPDGTARQAAPPPVTGGGLDLPSVIVVPRNHVHDENLGNGCWVRLFNDKFYRGRSLTLVGPSATVTTFDYEYLKNRTAVLHPVQRIPDLRDRELGLFEDIHSVRIRCKR
jgi:hypothetical protein